MAMALAPLLGRCEEERFYLGTFTGPGKADGIYTGLLDETTGKLGSVRLAAKANNPGYLALSRSGLNLYAVSSDDGGSVEAFRVERDGSLTALNRVSSGGAGPCHLSVTGRHVLVANYGSGDIASISILNNGQLGKVVSKVEFQGSGPNHARQEKPHAHYVAEGANGVVYACDLGTDHVWSYGYDGTTGEFGKPLAAQGKVPAGSGPRHLAFDGDFAYVNGEMGRNITVFHVDKATGALMAIQTLPLGPGAAPAAAITTAEVVREAGGPWLYVSSRGDDIIAVFKIGPDGKLAFVEDVPCMVTRPRGMGIDPAGKWLIVAGQDDGRVAVFSIDPMTGKLSATGQEANVPSPVCVLFEKAGEN